EKAEYPCIERERAGLDQPMDQRGSEGLDDACEPERAMGVERGIFWLCPRIGMLEQRLSAAPDGQRARADAVTLHQPPHGIVEGVEPFDALPGDIPAAGRSGRRVAADQRDERRGKHGLQEMTAGGMSPGQRDTVYAARNSAASNRERNAIPDLAKL